MPQASILDIRETSQKRAKTRTCSTLAPKRRVPTKPEITIVTSIHVYPEDRVSELKEKLAAALAELGPTNIKNFNTHWYARTGEGIVIPLSYRISADGAVPIDIEAALAASGPRILGIPLDMHMYQNKGALTVHALDYFTNLGDLYMRGIHRYSVVCIDEFFRGQEHLLSDMLAHDPYQLEMLYSAFVLKYFPLMSFDVFKLYESKGSLSETYPDLMGPPGRFKKETEILDEKYRLLSDAKDYKKHPDLRKYQPEVSINPRFESKGPKIMQIVIKSIVLNISTSQLAQINMRNLFDYLTVSAELPLTRLKLLSSGRFFVLSKLYTGEKVSAKAETELQRIYEIVRPYFGQQYYNTVLIVLRILEKSLAAVTIFDNGTYQARILWDEETELTFVRVVDIIDGYIAPLAKRINEFGRQVFENSGRLAVMSRNNVDYAGLNVALVWRVPIPESTFDKLKKKLREHMDSYIIRPVPETDVDNEVRFYMMKGMTYDDPHRIEELIPLTNYYAYLTDVTVRQRWLSLYAQRLVLVTRFTTDVRFEIHNIKEQEFGLFYQYVITLLYWLEHSAALSSEDIQRTLQEKRKTGVLQTLKAYDPALYVMKRYGSDLVYSRLCQKAHQPVPYTEEEYEYLDPRMKKKAVKYWNFTSGRPMYYMCPDPRYPKLHFIVDRHPMGYCIPCCMKQRKEESRTKKDRIFEICMRDHQYGEQETEETSRYIMNYGKTLEPGRISRLPDLLERYIKHTKPLAKSVMLESSAFNVYTYKNVDYAIPDIIKRVAHTKAMMKPMAQMKKYLDDPAIKEILDDPQSYPLQMAHIKNAKLDPIILLAGPELDGQPLVDGLYRLARFYLENAKEVPVRYITTAQLIQLKAATPSPDRATKEPAYYLFGVNQTDDLGGVYSVATALQLEVAQMAELCIQYMTTHPDIDFLRTLLNGQLLIHFQSLKDLLAEIHTRFILGDGPSVAISYFSQWNELFIDMAYWCFGKGVYIIEDTSVATTGTSAKGEVPTNIEIVYNRQILGKADDYVVLFRRRRRGQRLIGNSYVYYPVFIIVPRRFFSDAEIERRLYAESDDLPQMLRDLVSSEGEEEFISLKTALDFGKNRVKQLFVNRRSYCYAVMIDNVYFPVEYEIANVDIETTPAIDEALFRRLSDFRKWKALIQEYNAYVCDLSEKLGRYRVVKQDLPPGVNHALNKREAGILPAKPLIKIERLILLDNQVIGAISQGWRYYFRPAPLRTVLKDFLSGYWLWRVDPRSLRMGQIIWRDTYPVYSINKAITSGKADGPHKKGLPEAYYRYSIFQLYLTKFITYLDGERNEKIRSSIKALVADTNLQDMNAYNALIARLREIVNEDDLRILTEQLHMKAFLVDFDNTMYAFDRMTLNRLARTKDKEKVRSIVDAVSARIVAIGTPKNSYYHGNKLIMKKDLYETVADELAEQFVNPNLRTFLLQAVILDSPQNFFRFTKQPNTKIYVRLETPKIGM